jgi:DNA (cytosine-5)-methyltransferase 1
VTALSVVEICGGAGGQALGLERAGWTCTAIAEIEPNACNTLRVNRPAWKVLEGDIRHLDGRPYAGAGLLAGGVPCTPFTVAGAQLGESDERHLLPEMLRLAGEIMPAAVLIENVPGLATAKFAAVRAWMLSRLDELGYISQWTVLQSADYGVPQLRPRFVFVAFRGDTGAAGRFVWPEVVPRTATVGSRLADLMGSRGWPGARAWADGAQEVAPTLVGGSWKHGGADVGPTRAKAAWRDLGVDGMGIADLPPGPDFPAGAMPKLTVRAGARLQGFPDTWQITGRKTTAWRQVGNAFPPPVAAAVGQAIRAALDDVVPSEPLTTLF